MYFFLQDLLFAHVEEDLKSILVQTLALMLMSALSKVLVNQLKFVVTQMVVLNAWNGRFPTPVVEDFNSIDIVENVKILMNAKE